MSKKNLLSNRRILQDNYDIIYYFTLLSTHESSQKTADKNTQSKTFKGASITKGLQIVSFFYTTDRK